MRYFSCRPVHLPVELQIAAAQKAVAINPLNRAPVAQLAGAQGFVATPQKIAVLTTKYWGRKGVHLTVGFMDDPERELRDRILSHLNVWGQWANVEFVESDTDPQLRIAREADGNWCYLGTDILSFPADQATMNLEGFTMDTSEETFRSIVRHEAGHALGFPHEHMRKELIDRIDKDKAYAYYAEQFGWSEEDTRSNVLTPLEDSELDATEVEETSIMCYAIPAEVTIDGVAIPGGDDITARDADFAARIYPKG